MTTKIEWVKDENGMQGVTWNPCVGCSHSGSRGCDHCFAERMANRLAANPATTADYAGVVKDGKWTGLVKPLPDRLDQPLKWRKPRTIFVCSMSDLFHENVHPDFIGDLLCVMNRARQHTFLVLTKRANRMKELYDRFYGIWADPPNLWLGVTVCTQAEADAKIPLLLQTPAAVRFISIEPMLEGIDLTRIGKTDKYAQPWNVLKGVLRQETANIGVPYAVPTPKLNWIIVGGETGPGARPMHPDWVRGIRDQCAEAGAKFFFKSWGEWGPRIINHIAFKRHAGRMVEGVIACSTDKKSVGKSHYWCYPADADDGFRDIEVMERVGKKSAGNLLDGIRHADLPGREATS